VFVVALAVELHLPDVHSLKQKRAVVKPILEGARHRHHVSAAEVGHQDTWQRASLGFAVVASSERQAITVLDELERFVWSFPEVEVLSGDRHWMEVDA
jgi:uncharacterized protein YlxP (DUF503 family)